MTRALLAWELGEGQGHIHRLAAIALKLETYGIEPVFALKNFNPRCSDLQTETLKTANKRILKSH